MGQLALVTITGTTILVPCLHVRLLQLIWRLGTRRWNLRLPDRQMSLQRLNYMIGYQASSSTNTCQVAYPIAIHIWYIMWWLKTCVHIHEYNMVWWCLFLFLSAFCRILVRLTTRWYLLLKEKFIYIFLIIFIWNCNWDSHVICQCQGSNPCVAENFWESIKIYLHFQTFCDTETAEVD